MKAIRFLMDYQGKLTAEAYFLAGAEEVFDDKIADALIAAGRCVPVVKKSAGAKNKATKPQKTK